MSLREKLRGKMIGLFGRALLGVWIKSSRLQVLGEEKYLKAKAEGKPLIFLIWHGRLFLAPHFFRHRGIAALVSPSKDGEIIAQIASGWGFRILRGSSSHAIIRAWNEMKKELQEGGELILIPDGPKGPNRELKPGCLKLAQETGAPLVLFSFSASKKRFLKSWDNFLLPYPFSKIAAIYGEPMAVSSDLDAEAFEKERRRVERLLRELDAEADRTFEKR